MHLLVQAGHIFNTDASRVYRIRYGRRYKVGRLWLSHGAQGSTGKCKCKKKLLLNHFYYLYFCDKDKDLFQSKKLMSQK